MARENVCNARLIKADMATLDLPPASFDAVTAFYSIAHAPRGQHGPLFRRIATWLRGRSNGVAGIGQR